MSMPSNSPYSPPKSFDNPTRNQNQAKHSGIGIASFVLSLFAGLGVLSAIACAIVLASQSTVEETRGIVMLVGFMILGSIAFASIGTILGIVGCFQQNQKKVYAVLGLAFSGLILLGTCGIMLVGFAVDA